MYVFHDILTVLQLTFILQRILAVLITLTPGYRNEFIDCQNTKVCIGVPPSMDETASSNLKLHWLEGACQLREFTCEWLQNPEFCEYWPLITTQDEWTSVKYVIEVIGPFQCRTLGMLKGPKAKLHHITIVYNDRFDHLNGVKRAVAKKLTPWKEDLHITVRLVQQKLIKYYANTTPMTAMLLILTHLLDPSCKLRSFNQCDDGMNINLDHKTSYDTQYQQASLVYVVNNCCAKHRCVPVITPECQLRNSLFPSATTSGARQSSFDPYDLSSYDEEYVMY